MPVFYVFPTGIFSAWAATGNQSAMRRVWVLTKFGAFWPKEDSFFQPCFSMVASESGPERGVFHAAFFPLFFNYPVLSFRL